MKCLSALIVLALVSISPINAQTAKVIALSPETAKEAKALYEQRDLINRRIEELRKNVETIYLSDEKPGPGGISSGFIGCGMVFSGDGQLSCSSETPAQKKIREDEEAREKLQHHLERKQGWLDFEFSEDFKFVVPKPMPTTTWTVGGSNGNCWNSIVPANGTFTTLPYISSITYSN